VTDPATPSLDPAAAGSEPLRALVIDDEESMRHFLRRGLARLGFVVEAMDRGEGAAVRWTAGAFDFAVIDLKMPGVDGITVLGQIRTADPDAVVLLMTAYGTVASAVEAMQLGAADFVMKPFEMDELALRIERALLHRRTENENRNLRRLLDGSGERGFIARSRAMRDLVQQIELLADSTATVLLTGESGSGKGLVARTLHQLSSRAKGPFVALHCPAVPETLLESELFGHEPGAFTGARQAKLGLIAKANRGTLFLDEVTETSQATQAKIAAFLQDREFTPLGATQPVRVDVRVLAATNRTPEQAVQDGLLRRELLWRLDVVRLHVPPLRARREDIGPLVVHRLQRLAAGTERQPKTMTMDALAALAAYDWPGNVRELENVVERMSVMAGPRDVLGVPDLPDGIRGAAAVTVQQTDYEVARQDFDRAYFTALLARCGGSVTEAARTAGISRGHLHRRIRELGVAGSGSDPE
jgi:DNA-binding NtrC family response regulator